MKAKEFRTEAREKLAGKWGDAALIIMGSFVLYITYTISIWIKRIIF